LIASTVVLVSGFVVADHEDEGVVAMEKRQSAEADGMADASYGGLGCGIVVVGLSGAVLFFPEF
jgi:hypothetical protein